jgi:cytochrome P450
MSISVPRALEDDFNAIISGRTDVDRPALWARLREEAPTFFSERLDAWVATRYEDVRGVLANEEGFANLGDEVGSPLFGRSFVQWRGREHNKKTGLVARRVRSPRAINEHLEPLVERFAAECAAQLPLGEPIDLKSAYTMWIPLLVIAELTGIPQATELSTWYDKITKGGLESLADPAYREPGIQAIVELKAFVTPIIEARRKDPGDDLISDLVQAEYDGAPLPNDEIISMVSFLLAAGVETTERALASAFTHLALNPDLWHTMRERRHDRNAINAFSVEVLRCFSPVQTTTRRALAPAELSGASVSEGDRVFVILASANRDPSVFEDPDRFDPDRFAEKPERQFTAAGEVLPFGAGVHHCTGSRLAGIEMLHGLQKILDLADRIEPAGELPPAEGIVLYSPPGVPVVLSKNRHRS